MKYLYIFFIFSVIFIYITGFKNKKDIDIIRTYKDNISISKLTHTDETIIANRGTIMERKVYKDDVQKAWSFLQSIGLNSKESLLALENFYLCDGAYIYYKELKQLLKKENPNDKTTAYVLKILTGAYNGLDFDNIYVAKDEKDKVIQSLILEQLENPRGKESLIEALEKSSYLYNVDEIQNILDKELENNRFKIPNSKLYSIKVKHSFIHADGNQYDKLLQQIDELPKEEKSDIFPMILHSAQFINHKNDELLRSNYIEYIKKNMPNHNNIKVEYEKIAQDTYKSMNIDDNYIQSLSNENEKKIYLNTLNKKVQKKYLSNVNETLDKNDNSLYIESIKSIAYASTTEDISFYDALKDMYLKSDDYIFENTILNILKELPDTKQTLKKDNDIKRAMIEKSSTRKELSSKEKREYDWYINNFFNIQ